MIPTVDQYSKTTARIQKKRSIEIRNMSISPYRKIAVNAALMLCRGGLYPLQDKDRM